MDIKFCINCKYLLKYQCLKFENINLVTGVKYNLSAMLARNCNQYCGKEAKCFEPKLNKEILK